jgi:asparagine synthase (glutamine-hydrolysing)
MTWTSGNITITFNGEIYNFATLRTELESRGTRFSTRTDTEVLLHLFRTDGSDMVHRLRGMFAFAIWDAEQKRLFLARDPYGIKPLYYADDGQTFRFASAVRALLAGGAIPRQTDPGGLVGFLLWGSVPEPITWEKAIRALPAGTMLEVSSGGLKGPRKYWNLASTIRLSIESSSRIPRGEENEFLRDALRDSVRAHMVSDVPVGAFLSAGLDSSTVVGLARQISGSSLRTLTLTSAEFGGARLDEAPGAIELAKFLDVQHRLIRIDMATFDSEFGKFLDAMDQPTIDGLNTWFVSKAAQDAGLKVVLSGLGGDELLGGYWTFRSIPRTVERMRVLSRAPLLGDAFQMVYSKLCVPLFKADPKNAALVKDGGTFHGAYAIERGLFRLWELPKLVDREVLREGIQRVANVDREHTSDDFASLPPFAKVMVLEGTRYMRNQLLRDSDWTGMAHSLEIRVPLVDRALTERVAGLSATGRLGFEKTALARVLDPQLPNNILKRAKTGFTIPIWKWLRQSKEAQTWRRVPMLRSAQATDLARWAYVLLSRTDRSAQLLV